MRGKIGMLGAAVLAASAMGGMTSAATDGAMRIMKSIDGGASDITKGGGQSKKSGARSSDFVGGAWLRLRGTRQRRAGYGWTNMHQKRVARKARNVKRSRRK